MKGKKISIVGSLVEFGTPNEAQVLTKKVLCGQLLASFQTYYTVPKFLKVFIIRLNKMPTATYSCLKGTV